MSIEVHSIRKYANVKVRLFTKGHTPVLVNEFLNISVSLCYGGTYFIHKLKNNSEYLGQVYSGNLKENQIFKFIVIHADAKSWCKVFIFWAKTAHVSPFCVLVLLYNIINSNSVISSTYVSS
jgi:hypothetical protein